MPAVPLSKFARATLVDADGSQHESQKCFSGIKCRPSSCILKPYPSDLTRRPRLLGNQSAAPDCTARPMREFARPPRPRPVLNPAPAGRNLSKKKEQKTRTIRVRPRLLAYRRIVSKLVSVEFFFGDLSTSEHKRPAAGPIRLERDFCKALLAA